MNNAKKLKLLFTVLLSSVCGFVSCIFMLNGSINVFASAEQDTLYCDSVYEGEDYAGASEQVAASYDVYFDSVEISNVSHTNAPSFGNTDSSLVNACAPIAGLNIVCFYDRWYTQLIPNYDTGMTFADGTYHYYPDMGLASPRNTLKELYSLMKTGELGGTSSANFKSGLNSYVENIGYSTSYSSFYSNNNSVDLNKLTTAIQNNKVGIVMCSKYNYVSDIINYGTQTHITKRNSTVGHMMMVYGYVTYTYYKDNCVIRSDTFLKVCSSYSSGEVGYMQLYDYSVIDEALIINIS